MSIEKGRAFFRALGMEDRVIEFDASSATVELAAAALGVDGARIAKSLTFKKDGGALLIAAAGDARVDNRKFKDAFGCKAKMLSPDEVLALVGHPVGGVCPFGINEGVEVAKESERGIVDLETLKKTNQHLIDTLEEVRQIQDDGRARRAQAELELGRIEGELKQKLLEMKG